MAREYHRAIVAGAGFEVRIARDRTEAPSLLRERAVDVEVTGLEMPKLDGSSPIRAIRSYTEAGAIVNPRGDGQPEQRTLADAAHDVFVKTAIVKPLESSIVNSLVEVP